MQSFPFFSQTPSILVGPKKFIQKVRHFRKLFGAGTRQTGPLVAAARTALLNHFPKLSMTHQLAKYLEKEMRRVGIDVLSPAETSMVSIQIHRDLCLSEELTQRMWY